MYLSPLLLIIGAVCFVVWLQVRQTRATRRRRAEELRELHAAVLDVRGQVATLVVVARELRAQQKDTAMLLEQLKAPDGVMLQ